MTVVRIADLEVDPRAQLDPERVVQYAVASGPVAPVVVFDTGDGLLLADGYHRLAAARLRGADTIGAEIRRGNADDARRLRGAREPGITLQQAVDRVREHSAGWAVARDDDPAGGRER